MNLLDLVWRAIADRVIPAEAVELDRSWIVRNLKSRWLLDLEVLP